MKYVQADLFGEEAAAKPEYSAELLDGVRKRLLETLARLESVSVFPWTDPLEAIHEENRFQRASSLLGEEGEQLWARFDKELDRLYAAQIVE
jgi:hypothetical protein